MSNQESSSVLIEPEPTFSRHGSTGTSHVLTINVTGTDATISDPGLRLHNGDTVVWRFGTLSTTDTVEINFEGPKHMQSTAARVAGTSKVRIDVSETEGTEEVPEVYSVKLNGTKLNFGSSFLLGDPITPQLVIDTMGGM